MLWLLVIMGLVVLGTIFARWMCVPLLIDSIVVSVREFYEFLFILIYLYQLSCGDSTKQSCNNKTTDFFVLLCTKLMIMILSTWKCFYSVVTNRYYFVFKELLGVFVGEVCLHVSMMWLEVFTRRHLALLFCMTWSLWNLSI